MIARELTIFIFLAQTFPCSSWFCTGFGLRANFQIWSGLIWIGARWLCLSLVVFAVQRAYIRYFAVCLFAELKVTCLCLQTLILRDELQPTSTRITNFAAWRRSMPTIASRRFTLLVTGAHYGQFKVFASNISLAFASHVANVLCFGMHLANVLQMNSLQCAEPICLNSRSWIFLSKNTVEFSTVEMCRARTQDRADLTICAWPLTIWCWWLKSIANSGYI